MKVKSRSVFEKLVLVEQGLVQDKNDETVLQLVFFSKLNTHNTYDKKVWSLSLSTDTKQCS